MIDICNEPPIENGLSKVCSASLSRAFTFGEVDDWIPQNSIQPQWRRRFGKIVFVEAFVINHPILWIFSRYYAQVSGGIHLRGLVPGQHSSEETS